MTFAERVDSFFEISARKSTPAVEIRAGVVTFLSMCYAIVVIPTMLSDAGMTASHVFTAAILVSAAATAIMALYARYPIALAPSMSINAFFTYTVVVGMGYTWQQALAGVFISGSVFLLLSVGSLRQRIVHAIPSDLRLAISAGIGCFLLIIGLHGANVIVGNASTLVTLGDLTDPAVLLALAGIFLTVVLYLRKVTGSIFVGILITAAVGMVFGIIALPTAVFSLPAAPDAGAFITGLTTVTWDLQYVIVIISMLLVSFFDSTGTIMSVGQRAGLMNEDGNLKGGNRAFVSDAAGTMLGATLGVSPVGSYAESTTGIESGGRTGLMSLTVSLLFLAALFCWPLLSVFSYPCTVSALVIVAIVMMSGLKDLHWNDSVAVMTAVTTITFMMLTYSIADGLGFGILFYTVGMAAVGRRKEVSPILYGLAAVYLFYFAVTALIF